MPITDLSERKILGSGLFALAGSLVALAAALGAAAFGHMTTSADICGSNPAHCLTCVGALACLAAALAVGSAGLSLLRPRRIGVAAA
ncbi:MAG: hypothetical protein K0M78_06135 [Brevundimonas sp.]|nr:hypothetical protein [Brevundimonas sp.]